MKNILSSLPLSPLFFTVVSPALAEDNPGEWSNGQNQSMDRVGGATPGPEESPLHLYTVSGAH